MSVRRNDAHAVFAICRFDDASTVPFRIGQPTDWNTAIDRWDRLDKRRIGKGLTVKHDGRSYPIRSVEVRAVDSHGRGLGSLRHGLAFPVPYRNARVKG